jgi:hypothetical protein
VPHLVSLTPRGATNPLNWTEVGPKAGLRSWGNAIVRATRLLIVGMSSQHSNLQPFGQQLSGRNCDFPEADF